jgi:hypothetical protein
MAATRFTLSVAGIGACKFVLNFLYTLAHGRLPNIGG